MKTKIITTLLSISLILGNITLPVFAEKDTADEVLLAFEEEITIPNGNSDSEEDASVEESLPEYDVVPYDEESATIDVLKSDTEDVVNDEDENNGAEKSIDLFSVNSNDFTLFATNEITVTTVEELQSAHNYANNTDTTWIYTDSGAESLSVTFSSDTKTESGYDYIYIYDGEDTQIGKYDGSSLAGQTIEINGDTVKIRLTSDNSQQEYGFKVTDVEAVYSTGPIQNLRASFVDRYSINLLFSQTIGSTSAIIEQSGDNGETWTQSTVNNDITPESRTVTVTELAENTTYKFRLVVIGGDREGVSNEVTVTTRDLYNSASDFEFSDGVITKYIGTDTIVNIPPQINDVIVTSIGINAFSGCSGITSITIPDSVTSIDSYAFEFCTGLTSVTIGNGVTIIGDSAFDNCSGLTTVNFNATNCTSMSFIHPGFSNCSNLTTVNIGENVTQIPAYAFKDCTGLTNITIPDSVTSIGEYAFRGCTGLTSLIVGNSVARIGHSAFFGCTGLTSVIIGRGVTSIGDYAFYNCSGLTTVNFNATNCTSMGSSPFPLFEDCTNLTTINIGENVTQIPAYAFSGCSGLTSVTIPDSVTSIGDYAFRDCSALTTFNFNATNCTSMSSYSPSSSYYNFHYSVFERCTNLTSVNIGDNVTQIPAYAFCGCSALTSVTIPDNVTSIGGSAFDGCSGITSITIPDSVTSIGDYAFRSCSGLTTVNFNATNCTSMGSYSYPVFKDCTNLTTVNIGDNVTQIPAYAFYNCSGITSVTIPDNVTSVGELAFSDCSGLTTVNFNASNCTSMGSYDYTAFRYCSKLATINIGDNVTQIPNYAFRGSGITTVTIGRSVKSIGGSAFEYCSGIKDVYYNGSYKDFIAINYIFNANLHCTDKEYEKGKWGKCGASVTYTFDDDDTVTIGGTGDMYSHYDYSHPSPFSNNSSIKTVAIENGVTSIGEYSFYGCNGITSITRLSRV